MAAWPSASVAAVVWSLISGMSTETVVPGGASMRWT